MWFKSFILLKSGVRTDEVVLLGRSFSCPQEPIAGPRDLLLNVSGHELYGELQSYTIITAYPARLDQGLLDIMQPVTDFTEAEQQRIREWLIEQSWEAWARSRPGFRHLVGDDEEPLSLSNAATHHDVPLVTLQRAGQDGRLPVIWQDGGRYVYPSAIREAYERGHMGKSGPKSGKGGD